MAGIYKTPRIRERLLAIYDAKMALWPVPYEDVFVDTTYGRVHVVVSGPEGAPPMVLLHASGVASWSWRHNVEGLSRAHRVFAIDLIGDAGRSELDDWDHRLRSGRDQGALYLQLLDALSIARCSVVGASEGGFIATNLALHAPDRVDAMVLLGPMGYAGAIGAIARIVLAQLVPLRRVHDATFRWAFSDSPALLEEFGEWFRLVMKGIRPAKVAPLPFSASVRRRIAVPTLFVFGARDNLVGDPERAQRRVRDIADVRCAVVDAGHLMAAERPEEVNRLVLDFVARSVAP
jgi:pimeloyl-ACP methyl ester carboxylesterase